MKGRVFLLGMMTVALAAGVLFSHLRAPTSAAELPTLYPACDPNLNDCPIAINNSCANRHDGEACSACFDGCPICPPGAYCLDVVCPLAMDGIASSCLTGICNDNRCLPVADPVPNPPPGCYYLQVQCIQAPCPPILVCPPTPTPTPTAAVATPTPAPTCVPLPLCATEGILLEDGTRVFCAVDLIPGIFFCPVPSPTPTPGGALVGDLNNDGIVNIYDHRIFVEQYGRRR